MKFSIIIPNYNGNSLLKQNFPKVMEAVEHYLKSHEGVAEIVFVDDASNDNSINVFKDIISKISNKKIIFKVIKNVKNVGFASTVNNGVNNSEGEILILLNTDVAPEKDFLGPLILHFKDERIFAVGSMDKSIEGGKEILRGKGIGRWEKGFLLHSRGEVDKTSTLWVNGGSGAFRKSIWEKLGGFCSLYSPFYWEDIDLSYRAQKSGYEIKFEPKSIVVHEHEEGVIKQKFSASQIKTIAYRNQFIFVWINATDLDLQLLHIFWLPYHFLMAVKNRDWPFFKGFFLAVSKLPQIFLFSYKAKKNYTKNDKEVIKSIEGYV